MGYVMVTLEVIADGWPGMIHQMPANTTKDFGLVFTILITRVNVHCLVGNDTSNLTWTLRSFLSTTPFLWLRSCGGTLPRWWQLLQSLSSMVSTMLWHSQFCSEICLIFSRSWFMYWRAIRCLDEETDSKSNPSTLFSVKFFFYRGGWLGGKKNVLFQLLLPLISFHN